MPHGALIKLVPAHWSKGDDLNKNTRSCWYRPGFRWSPERGQSVIPKDLEKFEVIVLKFQMQWMNKLDKILKTNDDTQVHIRPSNVVPGLILSIRKRVLGTVARLFDLFPGLNSESRIQNLPSR